MGRKTLRRNCVSPEESKTPPILEIGFSDPLFSTAAHPTRPIMVSGLGTGHVFCHTYNPEKLEDSLAIARSRFLSKEKTGDVQLSQLKKKWWRAEADHTNITNDGFVSVGWRTKRHKGSCRSVIFDISEKDAGENVFTIGTDNILKKAKTETGKVQSKFDTSSHLAGTPSDAITTLAMSTTNPFLLTGTENGNVLAYDSNDLSAGKLKFKVDEVHEDTINKILPMPAVSDYHFLALGSTRLAHIDIRKGIVTQSDDQADELLSMCYPTEFVNANENDAVIVSHGEGVITYWKNSVNGLSDQLSRVKINKNASIDAIISTMNSGDERMVHSVWCGDSDGYLHRVDYKKGKVVETRTHSSFVSKSGVVDEVGELDIDYDYRLVSSGMEGLKIWSGQAFDMPEKHQFDSESDGASLGEIDLSEIDSYTNSSGPDLPNEERFGPNTGSVRPWKLNQPNDELYSNDSVEEEAENTSKTQRLATNKKNRGDKFPIQGIEKKVKVGDGIVQRKPRGDDGMLQSNYKETDKASRQLSANHGIAKFDGL